MFILLGSDVMAAWVMFVSMWKALTIYLSVFY